MNPEHIGRYRIVDQIGRGGFATVYLGEDQGLDDLVAIKLLSADLSTDATAVTRFVAEARLMRNLRAPGVVTVHDVGEHGDRPYFVMEYCPRGTLKDRLAQLGRPLTIDEAVGLAEALGVAVGDLHRSEPPVVHRDLKPGNLLIRHRPNRQGRAVGQLLDPTEELIVGDFGLAKVVDPTDTKFTLIAYSRGFAPPEQLRGEAAIGPSADVYSASAVLAAALTEQAPNQVFGPDDRAFEDAVLARTGPLQAEIERGLSHDRTQRHPTIAQWAEAITAGSTSRFQPPPAAKAVDDDATAQAGPLPPTPMRLTSPVSPPTTNLPPNELRPAAGRTTRAPQPRNTQRSGIGRPAGLAVGAVGLLAVLAGLAIAATGGGNGPGVLGPEQTVVGQTVAFAVAEPDVTVEQWVVGDVLTRDQLLVLTPESAGTVTIEVETDDGDRRFELEVVEPSSNLSIGGPPTLPLEGTTTLTAEDGDGQSIGDEVGLIWSVGSDVFDQPMLEIVPAESGTVTIELSTDDGRTARRTFIVPPANG